MSDIDFRMQVPIGPEWRNVELLRSAILNCLAAVFQDSEFSSAVGMVAGELLENAIKYGAWELESTSAPRSRFRLAVFGNQDRITIEVCNPVRQGDPEIQTLKKSVDALSQSSNPQEAFFARLKELASRDPDDEGASRLGLPRIAHAGNAKIEMEIGDQSVTVRAHAYPASQSGALDNA